MFKKEKHTRIDSNKVYYFVHSVIKIDWNNNCAYLVHSFSFVGFMLEHKGLSTRLFSTCTALTIIADSTRMH